MQLQYHAVPDWPPLAWLAVCRVRGDAVQIYHGPQVEVFLQWFCEAAWPGDFAAGQFDLVENVAGSGGRCRDGKLIFVSATSTIDRLHSLQVGDELLISNSLPCLLHAAGASLRPSYGSYNRDINSIVRGLRDYRRSLETSAGPVQLTYFEYLVWDGFSLNTAPRINHAPQFTSFQVYREYLDSQLRAVFENAHSRERQRGCFQSLATVSTGYDSPAIATLAARCGCTEALSFDSANTGESDNGEKIAARLGLKSLLVSRAAWRQVPLAEVPFFASGQAGSVVYRGAEAQLAGRLLLTGFSGDSVWDLGDKSPGPNLVRGDTSGLGLTEFRLWAGFLNCPVPFWGARYGAQINAISNSPEMQPYVLPATDYNRPICRRIVEEAGVPREDFGQGKKAVEAYLWKEPRFLTDSSYQDYLAWLRDNRSDWWHHRRVPPWRSVRGDILINRLNAAAASTLRFCGRSLSAAPLLRDRWEKQLVQLRELHPKLINLRRYGFPWAVDRAKQRYFSPAFPAPLIEHD